jgi:methionine-rich copper-binding protein CopC
MFIKSLKIVFMAALAIALLLPASPEVFAASTLLSEQQEESQFIKAVPGAIQLTFISITKHINTFEVTCEVKPSKDRRISFDHGTSVFKDANDVTINSRFDWSDTLPQERKENGWSDARLMPGYNNDMQKRRDDIGAGVYINDKQEDFVEAKAGETYKVVLRYWVGEDYSLTPVFPSVGISVNGLVTEFKDIPIAW